MRCSGKLISDPGNGLLGWEYDTEWWEGTMEETGDPEQNMGAYDSNSSLKDNEDEIGVGTNSD